MSVFFRALLVLSLLLMGWVMASEAQACSPPRPGISSVSVFPPDGSSNVPTNARINVRYVYVTGGSGLNVDFFIRPTGGSNVTTSVQRVSVSNWERRFFTFPNKLKPSTKYEVVTNIQAIPCSLFGTPKCATGALRVVSTFTTGNGDDTKAPTFSGLQSITSASGPNVCNNSACCGPYNYHRFDMKWSAGADESGNDFVLYNVYRSIDLNNPVLRYVPKARGAQVCSGFYFGQSWDSFRGLPGDYVVRAVDLANNEETNTVKVRLNDQCGIVEPNPEPKPEPTPEPTPEPVQEPGPADTEAVAPEVTTEPPGEPTPEMIMEGPFESSQEPAVEAQTEPVSETVTGNDAGPEKTPGNEPNGAESQPTDSSTPQDVTPANDGDKLQGGCSCSTQSPSGSLFLFALFFFLFVLRVRSSRRGQPTS